MIQLREAGIRDIGSIANLHAVSWREWYRGIWSDEFLDQGLFAERLSTWQQRLQSPSPNQFVLLAEEREKLCGFACLYLGDDPLFGSLLDNLHVATASQGKGIGAGLMSAVAKRVHAYKPRSALYLWALEENHKARAFYEKLGACNYETVLDRSPDGNYSPACRYVWSNVTSLI